ncbi:MAG: hypothetical protein K2X38_05860 [Gemmataceae bacterium]|nr:hypothetical protein [Gemmataceae bacterium]
MAVDLETRKPPKQELFVQSSIDNLRRRLHRLDVAAALLGLAIVVFGYALFAGIFDFAVGGSDAFWVSVVRGIAFIAFVGFAGSFALMAIRRWLQPLNPYFVAREIERHIPDAKNSVINWLDLKDEKLPPAIRTAVTTRAARDVKETDTDKAADGRTNWLRASVLGILLVGLMILLALSPRQFGSLMARAFMPFRDAALESRTAITIVRPKSGDADLTPNSRFDVAALIEGRHPAVNQPGAPTLHWRYHQKDAYLTLPLQEEAEKTWTAALLPDQVKSGFWYKITAGDASTPEHRVGVKSQPLVREFDVRYLYRPYVRREEERVKFPNETAVFPRIVGPRGTDIVLTVRANGPVREARIEIETDGKKKILPVETPADDPATMIARFKLDKSGSFRVLFQSEEGQPNLDRQPYQIEAVGDLPPSVTLTKPGEDVKLPANGTLPLEGNARDDWGIQSLSLQVRVVQGAPQQELLAKPYRGGKSFQFANGSYPDFVDYADFLALDALRNAKGEKFEAKPGMVFEYWLEARDNSDWPNAAGTIGKSNAFKILVEEANKDDKKQQEERKQAEKQAQDQQQKQDRNLKKEEQRRKDEEQQKNQGNPDDQKRKEELEKKLQDQADKLKKELDGQQDPKNKKNDSKDQKGPDNNPMGNGKSPEGKEGKNDAKDPMASNDPKEKQPKEGKQDGNSKQPMTKDGKENPNKDPMASNDPNSGKKEPAGKEKGKDGSNDPNPMNAQEPKEKKGDPMASNDPSGKGKEGPDPKTEPKGKEKEDPNGTKQDPKTGKKEAGKEGNNAATDPMGKTDHKADPISKGTAKAGPKDVKEQPKEGKGAPENSPTAKEKKEGPGGKNAEDPMQAKEKTNDGTGEGKKAPKLTPEQMEKFKKELAEMREKLKGPEGDKLAQEIAKKAKDNPDPEVRKMLESLMKDAGRENELAKEMGKKDAKEGPGGEGKETVQELPMPKKELDPMGKAEGDPSSKKKTDGAANGQEFNPNQKGVSDDPKGTEANKDFANRGGNLQLESIRDLMKKLTPENREKLGMSDAEWQQFQKNAAEYEKLMNRMNRPDGKDLKSGAAKIGPGGIRTVQGAKEPATPLESGQALPPPEFRDPQRIFTTRPKKE